VLHGHRIDDHRKRLVSSEQPVLASEGVAFEPSMAVMLAEDFHDAAFVKNMIIDIDPGKQREPKILLPKVSSVSPSFATRCKFCQFFEFFGPGSRINKGRWFKRACSEDLPTSQRENFV
jgi:hypothetical protein